MAGTGSPARWVTRSSGPEGGCPAGAESLVVDAPAVGGPVDVPLSWLAGDFSSAPHDGESTTPESPEANTAGSPEYPRPSTSAEANRARQVTASRDLVIFSLPPAQRDAHGDDVGDAAGGEPEIVTYVVAKGDTLYTIAGAHNTTVASICAINGIDSADAIIPGQHLTIVKNATALVRRVARGDTLWDIARAYGTTVEAIVRANRLSGDVIIPGQLLIIPVAQIPKQTWAVASAFKGVPLEWPVVGRITSAFGWRVHPITGLRHFHEGLDIAAPIGSEVRAVAAGRVTFVGYLSGYGRVVVIEHGNGLTTRYAHLSATSVNTGSRVETGQIIGRVGDSGYATGPHLHFEVRLDGQALDPRKFLR